MVIVTTKQLGVCGRVGCGTMERDGGGGGGKLRETTLEKTENCLYNFFFFSFFIFHFSFFIFFIFFKIEFEMSRRRWTLRL